MKATCPGLAITNITCVTNAGLLMVFLISAAVGACEFHSRFDLALSWSITSFVLLYARARSIRVLAFI